MRARSTILLCEDSEIDVELTLNALADFQLHGTIDVVHDGVEALDYLHRKGSYSGRTGGAPDLVLLDLKMPRMDGLEVLRAVKSDPHLQTTPVVMLSSSRQERDVSQSYRAGANAYVAKPVDAAKFTRVVEQTGIFWTTLNETPPRDDREFQANRIF